MFHPPNTKEYIVYDIKTDTFHIRNVTFNESKFPTTYTNEDVIEFYSANHKNRYQCVGVHDILDEDLNIPKNNNVTRPPINDYAQEGEQSNNWNILNKRTNSLEKNTYRK